MRFTFVILNYNSLKEAVNCVNSIKQTQTGTDYKIVIVDNNSPDGSGKDLDGLWKSEDNIVVIHNETNLGFSKGNNVGFRYAKKVFKSDFIILQNADTLVLQNDFQQIVIDEYEMSGFAVLGPLVKTPHLPYNSNPGPDKLPDINYFKRKLLKYQLHLFFTYLHIDKFLMWCHQKQIATSLINNIDKVYDKAYNVRLHGCFMVFSPKYIERFDGLNDKTFLYGEEDLLFLRLTQNGLISVYLPQIEIFHEEDASTNSLFKADNLKNRFLYKCKIQSTKVMIGELQRI